MRTTLSLVLSLFILVPGAASEASDSGTLLETLKGQPQFTTLVAALEFTGLDAAVANPEAELTVLAPTNLAFTRTLRELGLTAGDLLTEENFDLTTSILLYHVLDGAVPARVVRRLDGESVPTLQGDAIDIEVFYRWFIRLNGDTFVIRPDLRASNGIAHIINRVLLPPSIFEDNSTLFDRLAGDPHFSTLVAALEFTGLDEVLDDPTQSLTLLAPNNRAFDRTLSRLGLTAGDLLTEANRELTAQILLYHVIGGEVPSDAVRAAAGQSVPTLLEGDSVRVDVLFRRYILLNRSVLVYRTDVDTSNGIAHFITGVLLPPSLGF